MMGNMYQWVSLETRTIATTSLGYLLVYPFSLSITIVVASAMHIMDRIQRCVPTATSVNGNGHFNGMGMAVAPIPIAAAVN